MTRTRIAAALAAILAFAPLAQADDAGLRSEVAELRAQLQALQREIATLRQERAPVTPASAASAAAVPAPATAEDRANRDSGTQLTGYAELNYNRPTAKAAAAQADLRRAVLGFTHRVDDTTRIVGEFEWEHAIVSADDKGEAAVEQLLIEHEIHPSLGLRAGLMLMPLGLLNERHEPPTYYGVERNFVETAIIPSTWREGGVALYGTTAAGFSWSAGLTTGFDLGKWDATSDEGRESPLGSIHQEMQLAKARDPSLFVAGNWQGIPGLTLGGGVFTGKLAQGMEKYPAADARLVLAEAHARWQSGPFDVQALYAHGHISDTEALNLTLLGNPTPVPESFWGGYVQGAWKVWERDDSSLAPFLRYEAFNTAAAYAPAPIGLAPDTAPAEHVWTIGANYWLNPNIVFKADYQHFDVDDTKNRFDLGMGYMF
mgnify:CR=1 FL=1